MKERLLHRENISRTLSPVNKHIHQPSLHSILQNYRGESSVSQQRQTAKENTSLLNVQRLVVQLASRMISFSVIGVPGDTMLGRNSYVGRRINAAYPSHPPRDYGFLQNGAVRVTINFSEAMETDAVRRALTAQGLTIGSIQEGDGRGLT